MDEKKVGELLQKTAKRAPESDERLVTLGRALGEMALAWKDYVGDFYTNAGLERILKMSEEEFQEDLTRRAERHQRELARISKKYSPKRV